MQCQVMLGVKDTGEQLVLAVEVMIERALREPSFSRDVIHGDATVTPPPKKLVGPFENPLARQVRRTRHGGPYQSILISEFTLASAGLKWPAC